MPGYSTTPRLPRTTLIPLDDTIGALVIGAILSSSYCSRDSLLLKSFVTALLSLDTLHGALVAHALYVTVVTNFGDYASLTKLPWSGVIETIIGALVAGMVQFFYAWRIYALSKKSFILPFIISWDSKGLSVPYAKVEGLLLVYSSTALAFSITSDIIITVAMLYYLTRSKTGMKATNRAINTLVAYAISSGLVTTMFAIADLIATWTAPSPPTLIQAPFFFILVRPSTLGTSSEANSTSAVTDSDMERSTSNSKSDTKNVIFSEPRYASVQMPRLPARTMSPISAATKLRPEEAALFAVMIGLFGYAAFSGSSDRLCSDRPFCSEFRLAVMEFSNQDL
ncbi:hypothetical protein R3P38DRAFT_2792392 [Favolaschia claudopus]|uniref:DUF6534 domain-containing protein n=1 Tax=Favolaschia claudopus TaxID=2862362 RepID=A0AAW0AE84_9AGAR